MNLTQSTRSSLMTCLVTAGLVVSLAGACLPISASAGPLLDAWRQRHSTQLGQGGEGLFGGRADRGPAQIPAGVRIIRDVAYGNAPRQRMDVYVEPGTHDAPVIFMVHGGAWIVGDKSAKTVVEGKVSRWVPRGFVFISINYPMLPETPVIDQAKNVARALAYAQKHAREWGGDPGKFVLMGHSAGAHLVALVNADPELARAEGARPWLGTVALDSAAYDVVKIMQQPHLPLYDRAFGTDRQVWVADSPSLQLSAPIAPLLAVCSSQRQDSCPQARQFVAKAHTLDVDAKTLPEDLTHKQINEELGVNPTYTAQVEAFMRTLDPEIARLLGR